MIETGIIHFRLASKTHMHTPISTLAEMMNPTLFRTKQYTKIAQKLVPIFNTFFPLGHEVVCGEGQMKSPMDVRSIKIERTKG